MNDGKEYPAISLVKQKPEMAATLSKLVESRFKPEIDSSGNRKPAQADTSNLQGISNDIIEKSNDSESIMQLFPEMELTEQILISSVISPKDMSSGDIIITGPQGFLPPQVHASLINKIREYFDHEYPLRKILPDILKDVLFRTGSYPVVVIPESSIDDIINGTTAIGTEQISGIINREGQVTNLGYLGNSITKPESDKTKISLEYFGEYVKKADYVAGVKFQDKASTKAFETFVQVDDNFSFLKFPELIKRHNKDKVKNLIKNTIKTSALSLEANNVPVEKRLNDQQLQTLLYKSKRRKSEPVVKVNPESASSRTSVGKPLIMKLPSEAIIPVHVPGDQKNHIGFFVLLDEEGNPISKNSTSNHFDNLQQKLTGSGTNPNGSDMGSYLLEKAKSGLGGNDVKTRINNATKMYADIIETDLLQRLKNGIYGSKVELGRNQEVYRIMLARTFSNQNTRLLYLPAELVTYFAYRYDENGVGVSLMDNMRILNSFRAMMLFTRVMASMKNSIGRTNIKLKFDENDPDPIRTSEIAMHEIAKTRQQYFPLGINTPTDLVDWIQKSGYEFTFEGHPAIPEVGIEFTETNSNYVKPDTDLDDELKKRSIMAYGLSPETVDNGFSSEFATTVVSNNILLSKRVQQIQDGVVPFMTDHGRKVISNDNNVVSDLLAIIEENSEEIKKVIASVPELANADNAAVNQYLLTSFLESFELDLPKPDSITLENQMAAFQVYSDGLDKAIDAWINEDIMNNDVAGEIGGKATSMKAIIKAYYLRKWMAENNVFTELSELTTKDESGNPILKLFEIQAQHIEGLTRSSVKLLDETKGMREAANKDLQKITGGDGLTDDPAPSSNDSGDGFNFDDIGGGSSDNSNPEDPLGDDLDDDETLDDPTKPPEDLPPLDGQ
jgi:hypothetical protein